MTRDPNPRPSIDDDTLAQLVREVADSWTMPPVRLDQPAWRDRVRSPRTRRAAAARGWLGRLGQAATAAVALTVGAAVLGVWLSSPGGQAGLSPSPSSGRTPVTGSPSASQLPKLLVQGSLPEPLTVAVQLNQGGFALADLATGTLGSPMAQGVWGTQVRRASDGTFFCLCVTADQYVRGQATHAVVALDRFDSAGRSVSRVEVANVTGTPDPRDPTTFENPQNVATWTSFSADGRYAYVGWSARAHPVWHAGFAAVDLQANAVIQRLALADRSDGAGDSRTYADAPRAFSSLGSDRVVLSQSWYRWSPAASANATYHFATDAWTGRVVAGSLRSVTPMEAAGGCGETIDQAGALPSGAWWLACSTSASGSVVLRRVDADGVVSGNGDVSGSGIDGQTSVLSKDGAALYLWSPVSLTMTRVDLATGSTTTGQAPKPAAAAADPLTALGRWLAPPAAAKVLLSAGLAISPDGTRLYALGIVGDPGSAEGAGSAGVLVFDAASLAPLGRWAPTADFVSIAVSADGRFVYAAGGPDFGADGHETGQDASITVFDADGNVRLVAGQLGSATVTFPTTAIR